MLPEQLFTLPLPLPIAAVATMSDPDLNRTDAPFNSGLLVLRPNRTVLSQLLAVQQYAYTHVRKQHDRVIGTMWSTNETRVTYRMHQGGTGASRGDQFYLNGYFQNGWVHLPSRWNKVMHYPMKPVKVRADENAHFVGRHKPPWHVCVHHTYTDSTQTFEL